MSATPAVSPACFSLRTSSPLLSSASRDLRFISIGKDNGSAATYNGSCSVSRWRRRCPLPVSVPARRPIRMEWQDCTVKMEINVPTSVAYARYSDREAIPNWMPFISTVKILEDKPDLSRWSLKYNAFGQDIEFSWLARNMQPILNQKIHWRSLEGLPNRGAVRFYPRGASSCMVELTVSYEVPQLLAPVASALQPFLKSLLMRGLEMFAKYAKEYTV